MITQLIEVITKMPHNGRYIHMRNNVLQELAFHKYLGSDERREAVKKKALDYIRKESQTWKRKH